MTVERRKFRRNRTYKGAQLNYGDRIVECIIRDLSEGGAGVKVETTRLLPSEVKLVFRHGPRIDTFVKWRRADALGLDFLRVR